MKRLCCLAPILRLFQAGKAPRLNRLQLKWSRKTAPLNKRKNVYSFLLTSLWLSWERKTDAASWSMGSRLRCSGKLPKILQNTRKHVRFLYWETRFEFTSRTGTSWGWTSSFDMKGNPLNERERLPSLWLCVPGAALSVCVCPCMFM